MCSCVVIIGLAALSKYSSVHAQTSSTENFLKPTHKYIKCVSYWRLDSSGNRLYPNVRYFFLSAGISKLCTQGLQWLYGRSDIYM